MAENNTDHKFEDVLDTQLFLTLCEFFNSEDRSEEILQKAKSLIEDGANINAVGHVDGHPNKKTYLVAAAFEECVWDYSTEKLSLLFPFLFENGFDPSVGNGTGGSRMFCFLANYSMDLNDRHFTLFKYLIDHGVDPDLPCSLYAGDQDEEFDWKLSPHRYLTSRKIDNFAEGVTGPDCQKLFALDYFLTLIKEGKDFSQVEYAQKSVGRALLKLSTPVNAKLEKTSGAVLFKFAYGEKVDENLPSLKLNLSEKSLYYSYPSDLVIDARDPVEFGDTNLLPDNLVGAVIKDIGYGYSFPAKCIDPNTLTIVFENNKYLEIRFDRDDNDLDTLTVSVGDDVSSKLEKRLGFISCISESEGKA